MPPQYPSAQIAAPKVAEGDGAQSGVTLPALFLERAQACARSVALRRKRFGLWEELTFADYKKTVRQVATALIDLGIEPKEPVGLISDNRVEWLMADLGILTAGAVTCAMYATSSAEQVAYIMSHSQARLLIVENEEQLDKALFVRQSHPLECIVVMDKKGLERFSDPKVIFWDELIAKGDSLQNKYEDVLNERLRAIKPDDLAILVYTSGTTGHPKGVMLSHNNIVWACEAMGKVSQSKPNDELLSFLPLCHIAERTITVFSQIVQGSVVNFAESLDTVRDNLYEVRPHVFFAVPRIWEKLYTAIALRMRDATFVKRHLYDWAVASGKALNEYRQRKLSEGHPDERIPSRLQLRYALADRLVLYPLRKKLGLDRVRFAASGAAPISPDIIGYFQSIGVSLVEGYGQTESTAIITANPIGQSLLGTVGLPVSGLELKIAEDGEILARSPGVMLGYYKDAEATAETIDQEGFLHTGDVGEIDETGRLRITDRKKDLIITKGGKNIAPQYIESKLRTSAFIHDAVVIGERKKYITALIVLDEDNLIDWAQKNRVPFGAYSELAKNPEVYKLVDGEVLAVNQRLTHVEAVKKFRILEKRLDSDDGELTPTLKVRRKIIEQKYKTWIDEMYGE